MSSGKSVPKRAIARRACYRVFFSRLCLYLVRGNCKQQTHKLEMNESLTGTHDLPSDKAIL